MCADCLVSVLSAPGNFSATVWVAPVADVGVSRTGLATVYHFGALPSHLSVQRYARDDGCRSRYVAVRLSVCGYLYFLWR